MIRFTITLFLGLLSAQQLLADDFALYQSPKLGDNQQWMYQVEDEFIPLSTNAIIKTHLSSYAVDLKGQFSLTNQQFRTRINGGNPERFAIDFSVSNTAYRLEFNRPLGSFFTLFRNQQRLVDDHGRWYAYRDGLLDFRISNQGQLSLARGPVTLLNYDLGGTPDSLLIDIQAQLALFENLAVPLPNPYTDPYANTLPLNPASSLAWKRPTRDRYTPPTDGSTLNQTASGTVTLHNPDAKDRREATATFDTRGPTVVTCRIDSLSDKAGLSFASYNKGQRPIYASARDQHFVLSQDPANADHTEQFAQRGYIYQTPFYLRAIYGIDFIRIESSQDGEHWIQFEHIHVGQRYIADLLYLQLLLPGGAEGTQQHISLSHAQVEQFPILNNDAFINRWAPAEIKQNASIDALQNLMDQPGSSQAVVDATRELIPFNSPHRWRGQTRSINPELIMRRLGQKMCAEQDFSALPDALDTWYDHGFYLAEYQNGSDKYTPPDLVRAALYHAWSNQDWQRLRREAHRYLTLANPSKYNELAIWMADQADEQLNTELPVETNSSIKRLWPHPLRISADRSTMNLIGELKAAVADDEIDRAARILTREELSNQFINTRDEPDLYRPAPRIVEELIIETPPLQTHLIDTYNALGMIRVGRAEQAGDANQLALLARQFYGTSASRKAFTLLANRALSMGDFTTAAESFTTLLIDANENERGNVMAKLALVESLQGQTPTYKITDPVNLPGNAFTAQAFSNELTTIRASIAAELAVAGSAQQTTPPFLPTPGVSTNAMLDLPFRLDQPISSMQNNQQLALQQNDQLVLINLETQQLIYQSPEPSKDHRYHQPFRPVFVGKRSVTTIGDRLTDSFIAFNANGTPAWQHHINGRSASDPAIYKNRLYLLTRTPDETLSLSRVHPQSGVIEAQHRLIRHARIERNPDLIRPAFVGDLLVIPTRGMILTTDHRGQIRWIRRIPYVPYEADPHLHPESTPPHVLALDETRAVISPPCSPTIYCIDTTDGRILWQYTDPDRQFIHGRQDTHILLRNRHTLLALDSDTGQPSWRIPAPEPFTVFIDNGHHPILQLRLDAISEDSLDPKRRHYRAHPWLHNPQRQIRWFDPAAGTLLQQIDLPQDHPHQGYTVQAFPHKDALYLIAEQTLGAKSRYPKCQLVRMIPNEAQNL